MGAFLAKHQFLVIWICALAIIGGFAVLIIQLNGSFLPTTVSLSQPVAAPAQPPTPPPAPSVALSIQKNGKNNTLNIQWNNLPGGTTALNIFRGIGNDTSTYTLWQTVLIDANLNGTAQFNLNANDLKYEYYVQAVNGGGGDEGNGSSTVLWISNPEVPATSTPPSSGGGNPDNGNSGGGNSTSSNSTSTNNGNNNSSSTQNGNSTSTSSSTGTGGGNATHAGNPYYNPQIQITGYGTGNGSFWVQHVNQSVEVGWQDLPANTTDIVFYRSEDQDGPWNQFLEQQNPGSTGSYSLQIVDGSLGQPYYYEMIASQGTTASATYGPIYLPATGQ